MSSLLSQRSTSPTSLAGQLSTPGTAADPGPGHRLSAVIAAPFREEAGELHQPEVPPSVLGAAARFTRRG